MHVEDKKLLFKECIQIMSLVLKKNPNLMSSFRFERVYIETLLARSLTIGSYSELEHLFCHLYTKNQDKGSIANSTGVLNVVCRVLDDFFKLI